MRSRIVKTTVGVGAAVLLVSCGAEKPRERVGSLSVAEFALSSDDSQALQLDGCDCEVSNLPNPLECVRVEARVTESGEPRGTCETRSGMRLPIRRFSDMGLFNCVVNAESTAVECLDARLDAAFKVDIKGRIQRMKEKAIERLVAHAATSEAVEAPAPESPPAEEPPVVEEDVCEPDDARQAFSDRLNELLAAAGIDLVYEAGELSNGLLAQEHRRAADALKKFEAIGGDIWGNAFLKNLGTRNSWCELDDEQSRGKRDQFISLGQDQQWADQQPADAAEQEQLKAAQERFLRVWADDRGYCWTNGGDDDYRPTYGGTTSGHRPPVAAPG